MWDKPEQLTSTSIARPLRVAHLVDLDNAPPELFEEIISEAYSRWGGRRTLVVPAKPAGIDEQYADWLLHFDADVIYSYVYLNDDTVADVHERYCPGRLMLHPAHAPDLAPPRFTVQLPLAGLSSLSVLPAFAATTGGLDGPPRDIKVLTKFWDQSKSDFLQENFGFISKSFRNGPVGTSYPDIFTCLTLISQEALEDKRQRKDERSTFVTSENAMLDELASTRGPLTLAQLSEWYSPYLETSSQPFSGTCLIAGDTPKDRLLAWNAHLRHERPSLSGITTLRLGTDHLSDHDFLARIRAIIGRRGLSGASGRNDYVTLMSCSLSKEELEPIAERMRKVGQWLAVKVIHVGDPAVLAPSFREPRDARYTLGGFMAEPEGRATTEFQGRRAPVPIAKPWHMKEGALPVGLRTGKWILTVTMDRSTDHSRYANQRDVWVLPRRLRLERAFQIERDEDRERHLYDAFFRVSRSGGIVLPADASTTRLMITAPDDLEALRVGICNDAEWGAFDRSRKDPPYRRLRFAYAEPSDKGRYLLGVLGLFETVPGAFRVLTHGFWRDLIHSFGGVVADKNQALVREVATTLRRRLRKHGGVISLSTDDDLDHLARATIRCGTSVTRQVRYRKYGWIKQRWDKMVDAFLIAHPGRDGDSDDHYRDAARLDRSIQHLCHQEVLFQGREWRCRSCFNRNWVALTELSKRLTCSICGREEPAPVSGDWQFKANPFLIEAYRDHGTEAVVWALAQLWHRARASFYFAPSFKLWFAYPREGTRNADVEVDAVVVVDGEVYLVEGKTSAALDEQEISQLAEAAKRIRPNVLLIACMEEVGPPLKRAVARLEAMLPDGVAVEVMPFQPDKLDRRPFGFGF